MKNCGSLVLEYTPWRYRDTLPLETTPHSPRYTASIIYCVIYRPPRNPQRHITDTLGYSLYNIQDTCAKVVVCWGVSEVDTKSLLLLPNLSQRVSSRTHGQRATVSSLHGGPVAPIMVLSTAGSSLTSKSPASYSHSSPMSEITDAECRDEVEGLALHSLSFTDLGAPCTDLKAVQHLL